MKYEIIISPKDNQYCGKCTYKEKNQRGWDGGVINDWYCMLFNKTLSSWQVYNKENKPTRCGDCKLLTERFMKMPELDEVR